MNIQGSINQLLTLATLAARTSPGLQKNVKIKDLEKHANKLEDIIAAEQGETEDIDALYNIKNELFHMDPTGERFKELGKAYIGTTEENKEKAAAMRVEREKQEAAKMAEKEKQEASKKFAQDFTKDIGFNPVQNGMPKGVMAARQAQYSLNQEQEEKRAGRHILYDKHITGGSL